MYNIIYNILCVCSFLYKAWWYSVIVSDIQLASCMQLSSLLLLVVIRGTSGVANASSSQPLMLAQCVLESMVCWHSGCGIGLPQPLICN